MQLDEMGTGFEVTSLENGSEIKWFDSDILVDSGFASFEPGMRFHKLYVVDDGVLAGWSYRYGVNYYTVVEDGDDTVIEMLPNDAVSSEQYRKSAYIDGELSEREFEAAVVLSEMKE